jgi:hypothetical protein
MLNLQDPYTRRYASLSIADLLEAREAYHIHLMRMENVFATAIGLYRIRENDLDHDRYHPPAQAASRERGKKAEPRTMENTVVQPWSWPCVLVFVKEWLRPGEQHKASLNGQMVPPFLDLPDGRVIPTCVVQGSLWQGTDTRLMGYQFSKELMGGGYPVITQVQGKEHVGSVGCLVTDGVRHFALTNQHVAGEAGSEICTLIQGKSRRIGVSARRSLRSEPFENLYPGFAGSTTRSNLDAGLIDVDNLADWTAQLFGLGVLGPLAEFNCSTASLDWIGTQVVAHGAHSGDLRGEIKALFYRYRTVGGADYISDFLIGGVGKAPLMTMPGDSGTVWCVDQGPVYRPFALQWGGQKLDGGESRFTQYALASSLSVVCRELDVEIVADLNTELPQYWGAVGHYKIAERAIARTKGELNAFLSANLAQLTYPAEAINGGQIKPSADEFVPVADVPDVVWKTNVNRGGKAARAQENWNHYADMDLPGADGRTLFDLSGIDANQKTPKAAALSMQAWKAFYAGKKGVNQGALPFRAWQVFDDMVAAKTASHFLCAAGVLAHYVGDACQPLHGSMHADGLDGAATGVHGAYEETMIDHYSEPLAAALDALKESALIPAARNEKSIRSGFEAGLAILELMARAQRYLPPAELCRTYDALGRGKSKRVIGGLWEAFGEATAQCIADGARTLGQLWQAAYNLNPHAGFSGVISRGVLRRMYQSKTFLPSLHLAHLNERDYQA